MNGLATAGIAAILLAAIGLVLLARRTIVIPPAAISQAGRVARLTLKQARRIVVLVVGVTILIVGVIMIVAPGPAVVVIPLGLAVLATEFVWARRLLVRYKGYADSLAKRVGGATPWLPRPWMVWIAIAATALGAALAFAVTDWPRPLVTSVTTSMLLMEGVTLYLVLSSARSASPTKDGASRNPQDPDRS
jgi:hypothetical protein